MSKKSPKNKNKVRVIKRKFNNVEASRAVVLLIKNKQTKRITSPLHRFIYTSAQSFIVAFVLVVSFSCQGVAMVFANEVDNQIPLEANGLTDTPSATVDTALKPEFVKTEEQATTLRDDNNVAEAIDLESNEDISASKETEEITIEPIINENSTTSVSGDDNESIATSSDDIIIATTSTSTTDVKTDNENASSSVADPQTELPSEEENISSSTKEGILEGPAIDVPININYSDSGFTFSKEECTELATGSFYCLEPHKNAMSDALFAGPDSDGDLEIFLIRNGIQTQISNNQVDDAAPFFDQNSESIVWHRLINDRYQIISYDIKTGEEKQLTSGPNNNMEPMRQGKYTVWQSWIDNNWEIMLYDGNTEAQITHTSTHDIAPYIHGSLIVWNRYSTSGDKTIEMYDISSQTYVTVDDPAGLSVTNPRMVLVYDQMHPNGDVITKGYDLIAKRFIQLDTLPRQLPLDIPKSEPTHETRALIQPKPVIKSDEIKNVDINPDLDPLLNPLDNAGVSSSSDETTLDMTKTTEKTASSTEEQITDFDLIIEPLASTTNAEINV